MKCDEPFTYAEYENHQKVMHVKVQCNDCSEIFVAMDLESHKVYT